MNLTLAEVAAALAVNLPGPDVPITGWSFDTRTLAPGDLFFALRGEHSDGHDHLADAFARGAAAAITERPFPNRVIQVANTQIALEDLARQARHSWGGTLIGVTGSAGKTSTKDAIAALLSTAFPTGKTSGNFNNHIGVPISILRLPDDARHAVLELGMNHAGEIRHLASIARPEIGVVTNVGAAHIENFGSIDGIALAKRELIESLPAHGVAVLNADDARVRAFASVHPGKSITYGFHGGADVQAAGFAQSGDGAAFSVDGVRFETRLTGRHAARNVLAALAVARELGISLASLKDAVAALAPGKMRGERLEHEGVLILNDCYNSNPDAAIAMLDVLRDTPATRRIAVLGEMLELGAWSGPLHREVGVHAAASGLALLLGIRGAARELVEAALANPGAQPNAACFFEEPAAAGAFLKTFTQPGDAILFKGSRGVRVEKALEAYLSL
jgi:UDP-N-acetylmuramoyl-tripeptide--D-alanyl-D-alanine ligase